MCLGGGSFGIVLPGREASDLSWERKALSGGPGVGGN